MATETFSWPLWRSIMKWREVRSPPAWQTLETLSPWCSWTARPRHTSSTASKAAGSARAQPAATPWIALPRWNGAVCGGDPHNSKSKSLIWRMWTQSTAGHGSSSLLFSPSSTSSTGSTMSDGTILVACLLLFDYMFSILLPFSVAFIHNRICCVESLHKGLTEEMTVLDQALVRNVFIFTVFVSLVWSFYFLNMYCIWDMWQSFPNNSPLCVNRDDTKPAIKKVIQCLQKTAHFSKYKSKVDTLYHTGGQMQCKQFLNTPKSKQMCV